MITEILQSKNKAKKLELFSFTVDNTVEEIEFKFNLWIRYFFIKYLKDKDAPFHKKIDQNNIKAYKGDIKSFTNIAFRGGAKTARTKLFLAYAICNDKNHYRKYLKILAADTTNSTQTTTDMYNMLIQPRIKELYPNIFEKTDTKREETRSSFTTSTGIKVIAGTVGTSQRGDIQEESRPDLVIYDDFEDRTTIRSAVKTQMIWDNMEEARLGLSKDGACIYLCNYISERGNVHRLVEKDNNKNIVLIVPIIKDDVVAWERYTKEEIKQMEQDDDDFEGERLCQPSSGKDIYFDRTRLDSQKVIKPIEETAGFKIFHKFDPSHRTAGGHDISGGVKLDSSTSVYIDFDVVPARVIATFTSNETKPEAFGYEIVRQNRLMGKCLEGVENNYGTEAILVCKQSNVNLYRTEQKDIKIADGKKTNYGWNTNALTKPKMLASLAKAIKDGLLELSDINLIRECKGYTRNDLIENVKDPRLVTRHYDLLIACAIAWQMKDHAILVDEEDDEDFNLYTDYS